jgi:MFS family permease
VDDCFFLHERGAKIGYYTASLCLAGLAPVPAGYMLDSGTWRLLYYILAGLAGALFVLGFFIVVETRFDRSEPVPLETLEEYAEDHNKLDHRVTHVQSYTVPLRKTYLQQINPWSGSNPKAKLLDLSCQKFYLSFLSGGIPSPEFTDNRYSGQFVHTESLSVQALFSSRIPSLQSSLLHRITGLKRIPDS